MQPTIALNHITPSSIDPSQAKSTLSWHQRAISSLETLDERLERVMPNFAIQNKIDDFTAAVQKKFAPLQEFNKWIDSNGKGAWYSQLGTFLAKLPLRAARNILNLLFQIIKALVYTAVHPIKALNNCAKLLIQLVHELTKPETWSKIGVGIIGASLGQALVTGNPISVISAGIGVALLIGGLTAGAAKALLQAKKNEEFEAVKNACIAVEDSACGIEAAKAANMFCIGINSHQNLQQLAQADMIINSYKEIDLAKLLY